MQSIARGLRLGVELAVGRLSQRRLTGKGPFPVAQSRLGVVTGRLRQSVRGGIGPARIQGQTATVSIGSKVRYAAAHEFGFSGRVRVAAHRRRGHTRGQVTIPAHNVRAHQRLLKIPERKPIRTGLRDAMPLIEDKIKTAVTTDLNT
jgi:hypothetical protein